MDIVAKVKNKDGNVTLYKCDDNSFGVTANINGLYKKCYGLKEITACKRYNKYCNELAKIYINK